MYDAFHLKNYLKKDRPTVSSQQEPNLTAPPSEKLKVDAFGKIKSCSVYNSTADRGIPYASNTSAVRQVTWNSSRSSTGQAPVFRAAQCSTALQKN